MPVVTRAYDLPPWYWGQYQDLLSGSLFTGLCSHIQDLLARAERLQAEPRVEQYYLPMGLQVPVFVTWTVPELAYVAELRSGRAVHPTLRVVAHRIGQWAQENIPGLKLYLDNEPDGFQPVRGGQTIERK